MDSHKVLSDHCHIEYDKAGELTVHSTLASVQIAMEKYHTLKSEEEANEKLKEARQYIHHNGHNPYHVDKAIRIASGMKV